MQDCNPIDIPITRSEGLNLKICPKTPEEKIEMANVSYSSAIGYLMYAMMCRRPDICYAVGLVSRYQANLERLHWKAVKRILRYLKGTSDYSCYQGNNLCLSGYSDADWVGDLNERKSTLGYVFLLNNGAIYWSSKKQTCTTLSTMEAEFIACLATVQEAIWLRRFLQSLGVVASAAESVTVLCNSQAAIAYVKDPKYHGRMNHIDTKHNFIRDIVA